MRAHQRVDVAVVAVEPRHLVRDPVGRQARRRPGEMAIDLRQEPRMGVAHHLAEVGDLADLPEQPHRAAVGGALGDLGRCAPARGAPDDRRPRAPAPGPAARGRSSRLLSSAADRAEIEPRIAPEEPRSADRSGGSPPPRPASGSMPSSSAVVPKVPSLMWRPARPAICAISAAARRRGARPSNFTSWAKATWSRSMLRPMPMASVATR